MNNPPVWSCTRKARSTARERTHGDPCILCTLDTLDTFLTGYYYKSSSADTFSYLTYMFAFCVIHLFPAKHLQTNNVELKRFFKPLIGEFASNVWYILKIKINVRIAFFCLSYTDNLLIRDALHPFRSMHVLQNFRRESVYYFNGLLIRFWFTWCLGLSVEKTGKSCGDVWVLLMWLI